MSVHYLETSALVKMYFVEHGTDAMLRLFQDHAADQFVVLALTKVEAQSALRRRERAHELPSRIAEEVAYLFANHFENRFASQSVDDAVILRACALTDKYNLTTLDALQLAGFLVISDKHPAEGVDFISADQQLLRAAEREGADVVDASIAK